MGLGMRLIIGVGIFILAALLIRRVAMSLLGIGVMKTREFALRKPSSSNWESVLAHPGKIRLETLHAGDVTGTVYGIINLKDKKDLGIKEEKLAAPLLAHLVIHEKFGPYLVDTGFDSAFAKSSWGRFEGWLKKLSSFSVQKGQGIDEFLTERKVKLQGVFCTHFHEHQGGAPALPDDIPFVFGKGEKEIAIYPLMFSRFLRNKADLRTIDFAHAQEMPLVGKAVDIFGDGLFWAIDTPGHTKGHVSYLINGIEGQYLIMGDVCMCRKGYDLGVESGGRYTEDLETNHRSFLKLAKFLKTYPSVKPIFGHESDEYGVEYKGE